MTGDNGVPETPEWSLPKPSSTADVFETPAIPPNITLGSE